MKTVYSTAQLADLLSVNESTVKRWTDSGYIDCIRTKGGHRRFSFPSIIRFLHENKMEVPEIASTLFNRRELHAQLLTGNKKPLASEIKAAAMEGKVVDVLHSFQIGLAANPDLLALYSELAFPPLVEIGNEWQRGKISVDIEHLACNTIREALARLQANLHYKDLSELTAVCACYEGEEHDLALYCVSNYLTVEGWQVYHLGANVPTQDLVGAIDRRKPNLVILSAVIVRNERKFVRDVNEKILKAAHRVNGRLAVGGAMVIERFGKKLKADYLTASIDDYRTIGNSNHFRAKEKAS